MKGYKLYTYFIKYLSNKNTSKTCAFKSFLTIIILSELDAIFYLYLDLRSVFLCSNLLILLFTYMY